MLFILTAGISLCSAIPVNAVQNVGDSLLNIWRDDAQSDSIRIDAFKSFIWDHHLFANTDSALILVEELIEFSIDKGSLKGQALALDVQGVGLWILGSYDQAIESYMTSLELSQGIGDEKSMGKTLGHIGLVYHDKGDYVHALEYYIRGLTLSRKFGDERAIGNTLNNIGLIHHDQEDYDKASEYYEGSLKSSRKLNDQQGIANSLLNLGIVSQDKGDFDRALDYFDQSIEISREIGEKQIVANGLNNIGSVFKDKQDYHRALDYYLQSLAIKKEIQDRRGIGNTSNNIGKVYQKMGQFDRALSYCEASLEIGEAIGSLEVQREACLCLFKSYKGIPDAAQALVYVEKFMALEDSLNNVGTAKKLQQMEFEKIMIQDSLNEEKEKLLVRIQHDQALRKKDRQRNILLGLGMLALLLAGGYFSRYRYVKKSRDIISREKERSEELLLNILPAEIAEELKIKGRADARDFDQATILFTDFKGFTHISDKLEAKDLVDEIDFCFQAFDRICEKHNIEKIKTIGDAYMAAGGLPVPDKNAARNVVLGALEMADFIISRKKERQANGHMAFEMRVGIHTGNVVAGIVGIKKFQYDVWGNTVNIASRLETNGVVGKVNISQSTYDLLKDDPIFNFESRGAIKVKGAGEIHMYFVSRV